MAGANVPGLDAAPQISQNVPGVQFPFRQEFGRQGQSLEHVGESIENAASTGGQIYDEIQRQHDISTSTLASAQASVEHAQMREKIQQSSPDGFAYDEDGAPIKDRMGNQVSIAQKYWEDADVSSQNYQDSLSPRAAAMFRQSMQHTIVDNTEKLQNEGMRLQAQSSEQRITATKDTYSKDFMRSIVPDTSPYYTGPQQEDGSTKQYPSAQKLYDAIAASQLARQQMGPVQGKPGFYGPTEVEALKKGDAEELTDNWLTAAKTDLIESQGSRAKLHQALKDGSSTALGQINSLLDIVEGKDPQSMKRSSTDPALPTVNSSLTPAQIEKWRNDLLGMIPAAKEVDKSEYELQKQQLGDFAHGVKNLDQFTNSALFQKTLHAGAGIGLTDADRVKDLSSAFSTAVVASAMSATESINSPEAKRQAATANLQDAMKRWPQVAQMLGEKNTEGFGEAIMAQASKEVAAKLQEDERKMREDPVKYMQSMREGPQGPGGTPQYRNGMSHAIENRLDPSVDPSLFSIFKPMSNGKSVITNAQVTANNGYSRMFGSKADVSILSKEQFQDQAKRIVNSNDPRLITSYFKQLDATPLSAEHKEAFIQDLVHKGGLPQTYADALNLKTPAEREARWASLQAGAPAMPDGMSERTVQQYSYDNNKSLYSFLDRKYGPNSPEARTARNTYDKSWQDDFKQAVGRGMGESDAQSYANGQRDKTTGSIGIVGAQHNFFGWHWGSVGAQVPVEFGSNNYTPDQQQRIRDTLLFAQSKESLSKFKFVPPPGALPKNDNAPSDAENIANKASLWRRIGGGWRLQYQEVDKNNLPTGISQDVQFYGHDGKPRYYDVPDRTALAGPPAGAPASVPPSGKHAKPQPMEPKL